MTEPTAQKSGAIFEQAAVNYVTLSPMAGQACANCIFYRASGYDGVEWPHCHLVADWPQPIEPTGKCDRWELKPAPQEMQPEPIPVVIVTEEVEIGEAAHQPEAPRRKSFADRLREFFAGGKADEVTPFQIVEQGGTAYWLATFSNNFKDRDGEIISEAAWDGYFDRLKMGFVPMPELWIGHVKGTAHGKARDVFGVGQFVMAWGSFDDTPEAKAAIQYYRKHAKHCTLSHGFTFPAWALKDGVYEVINTFEISVLPPPMVAANPWYTEFEVKDMQQISETQLSALAAVLGGKDAAERVIAQRKDATAQLTQLGVQYKDFAEVNPPAKPDDTEASKAVSELVVGLVETQDEIVKLFAAQEKAFKAQTEAAVKAAVDAAVSPVLAELKALKDLVNAGPRAASKDAQSVEVGEKADDAQKTLQSGGDIDPLFAQLGMTVPTKG